MKCYHNPTNIQSYSRRLNTTFVQVSDMKSITEANHIEVSRRVNQLHQELVETLNEMQNTSEQNISTLFEKIARNSARTVEHCMLRTRTESILRSLLFETISDRESNVPSAHQNTFQWALSNERTTLPDWLSSGSGIYWIAGKAGSGKSTLMKFLQQEPSAASMLHQWAGGHPLTFASHYFWAAGTDMQKSLVGLFRTLLFKILVRDPELTEHICPLRLSEGYGHVQPWTLKDLEDSFDILAKMQNLPSKICFFIDGLDEFGGDPDRLIGVIKSISKSDHIKLCIASRPWLPFEKAYGKNQQQRFYVHKFTMDDIKLYAQDKLGQSEEYCKLRAKLPGQAESLVSEICGAADGVFLWVYLVIRELLRGLSNSDDLPTLRERLEAMPRDLDDFFDRMLKSIEDVYWAEACSLFSILAHTKLPIDTLITWAHRTAQRDALISSNIRNEFPAHVDGDPLIKCLDAWAKPLASSVWKSRYPYDAEVEQRRIVARCRDLVHVSEVPMSRMGKPIFQVRFLHRTVADFICSALVKSAGRGSANTLASSSSYMPLVALAETYLQLFAYCSGSARRGQTFHVYEVQQGEAQCFTWGMFLALQIQQHSPSAYLHVMHAWCYVSTTYFFDNMYSEIAIGTAMAANVFCTSCYFSKPLAYDWLFWSIHCRDCTTSGWKSNSGAFIQWSHFCQRPTILSLGADNTIRTDTYPSVNLRIVEMIIRFLMRSSSGDGLLTEVWRNLLHNLHEPEIPTNIFDVCLVFIRQGAPSLVRRSSSEQVDAMTILLNTPAIREADPTGKLLENAFRDARQRKERENSTFWKTLGNLWFYR